MDGDNQALSEWRTAIDGALNDVHRSRAWLSAEVGFNSRQAINRYFKDADPPGWLVLAIDQALQAEGIEAHHSRILGFVPADFDAPTSFRAVVNADELLTRKDRQTLLDLYSSLVRGRRQDQRFAESTDDAP